MERSLNSPYFIIENRVDPTVLKRTFEQVINSRDLTKGKPQEERQVF